MGQNVLQIGARITNYYNRAIITNWGCYSRCPDIYESITADNYAKDTVKETTNEKEKSAKKPRVIITSDSLLKGISANGLSKDNRVEIKKVQGGTTETILEEVGKLVKSKPDTLTVHGGKNDFTKEKNVWNYVKKILNW